MAYFYVLMSGTKWCSTLIKDLKLNLYYIANHPNGNITPTCFKDDNENFLVLNMGGKSKRGKFHTVR